MQIKQHGTFSFSFFFRFFLVFFCKSTSDLRRESLKGMDLEIRLYKNVKKVEFKYMGHKLIVTDPEALYVAFPFSLR